MITTESSFQEPEDTGSAWQEKHLSPTVAGPWRHSPAAAAWGAQPEPAQQNRQLPMRGGTGNEALMISSQ